MPAAAEGVSPTPLNTTSWGDPGVELRVETSGSGVGWGETVRSAHPLGTLSSGSMRGRQQSGPARGV